MKFSKNVNCYCFNKGCEVSIFHTEACKVTTVALHTALSETLLCSNCKHELISSPNLAIQIELKNVLSSPIVQKTTIVKAAEKRSSSSALLKHNVSLKN